MATKIPSDSVTIVGGLATNADICKLFNLTDKTVRAKLVNLEPQMLKGTGKYYKLSEVLPLIVKPKNVGDYIRTMNFSELPKDLTKEYWAGQRSRQIYLREAGDLWNTNEVVQKVGDAFKSVAMKIRLMGDQIERETAMTNEQRKLIETVIDETLKGIATELQTKFQPRPETPVPGDEADATAEETTDEELATAEEDDEL